MDSEHAAFQASQQKHYHNMPALVPGKKPRYIEVIQCSGDDMKYHLTGNTPVTGNGVLATPSSAASVAGGGTGSPVKNTMINQAAIAAAAASNPLMAAASAGLLPHAGMFNTQPQSLAGLGIDPNAMAAAASLQPPLASPFVLYNPFGMGSLVRPPPTPTSTNTTAAADMSGLLGLHQQHQQVVGMPPPHAAAAAAAANLRHQQPPQHQQPQPQNGLLAYNQAVAVQQQLQLQAAHQQHQQQLLQSQLAAQRMLLPGTAHAASAHAAAAAAAAASMVASNPKRSFDQAFNAHPTVTHPPPANDIGTAAAAAAVAGPKRANYGLGTPTISAGPTTYSR